MSKETIDTKYKTKAATLEKEFFDIVDEGKKSQHRVLKQGKTKEDFNQAHEQLWKDHETELLQGGFITPPPEPGAGRDLYKEIDDLTIRLCALEKR